MRSGREEAEADAYRWNKDKGGEQAQAPGLKLQEYLRVLREAGDWNASIYSMEEDDVPGGGLRNGGAPRTNRAPLSTQFELAINGRAHGLAEALSDIDQLGDYVQAKSDIELVGEWSRHLKRGEFVDKIRKDLINDGYSPPELDKRYLPALDGSGRRMEVPNYSADAVETHVEYSRLVALEKMGAVALEKDLSIKFIGNSGYTPAAFREMVANNYQRAVDNGYAVAKQQFDQGKLYVPYEKFDDRKIAEQIALGIATDRFAKGEMKALLELHGVPDGPFSVISVDRNFYSYSDPQNYRRPDILFRYGRQDIHVLDASLGIKSAATPQVRDTFKYGAASWTNVTPGKTPTVVYKKR